MWIKFLIIKLFLFYQLILFPKNSSSWVMAINSVENPECLGKYRLGLEKPDDVVLVDFETNNAINDLDFDEMPNKTILENDSHLLLIHLKFNENDIVPSVKINLKTFIGIKGTYRLEFLFFQWFEEVSSLLSHENVTFPSEFNALFYNVEAKSFQRSLVMDKAIVILTFAVEVYPLKPNSFEILRENLKFVQQPFTKISIPSKSLNNWFPADMKYFNIYEGTFQHYCQAKVLCLDFEEVLTITPDIVKEFEKLKSFAAKNLMQEVQPAAKPKGKVFTNISPSYALENTSSLTFYYNEDPRDSAALLSNSKLFVFLMGLLSLFLI